MNSDLLFQKPAINPRHSLAAFPGRNGLIAGFCISEGAMNPDTITPEEVDDLDARYVTIAVIRNKKELSEYFQLRTQREKVRNKFNSMSRQLFVDLILRDGPKCKTCGTTQNLTVDHIVPIYYGGTNDLDNLQILCKSCNSRKGIR